jgi:hypothetical protein
MKLPAFSLGSFDGQAAQRYDKMLSFPDLERDLDADLDTDLDSVLQPPSAEIISACDWGAAVTEEDLYTTDQFEVYETERDDGV